MKLNRILHITNNHIRIFVCEKWRINRVRGYGGHLEYCELPKGENFTPTWNSS